MDKNHTEYAGARRKNERRVVWNPEKHSHTMQLMQNDLEMGLRHCVPGSENDVLNRSLRSSPQLLWYKIIPEVKLDIFNALSTIYPSMRMEVYGSTLIGIAFKGIFLLFFHKFYFQLNTFFFLPPSLQTAIWIFTSTCFRHLSQMTHIK